MDEQAAVDEFARLAKPRLRELLKLKIRHIHELTAGTGGETLTIEGQAVQFRLLQTTQPYRDVERFLAEDKVMGYIINPGLLPIVKAISWDVRGRQMLVTRTVAARKSDRGVVGHIDDFGLRINLSFEEEGDEAKIDWECLYGVA